MRSEMHPQQRVLGIPPYISSPPPCRPASRRVFPSGDAPPGKRPPCLGVGCHLVELLQALDQGAAEGGLLVLDDGAAGRGRAGIMAGEGRRAGIEPGAGSNARQEHRFQGRKALF